MKQKKAVRKHNSMLDESLTVHFTDYGNKNLARVFIASNEIETALDESRLGILDGNLLAVDGSDGYLFLFGPDARKLYEDIKPILLRTPIFHGAEITLGVNGQKEMIHDKLLQVS